MSGYKQLLWRIAICVLYSWRKIRWCLSISIESITMSKIFTSSIANNLNLHYEISRLSLLYVSEYDVHSFALKRRIGKRISKCIRKKRCYRSNVLPPPFSHRDINSNLKVNARKMFLPLYCRGFYSQVHQSSRSADALRCRAAYSSRVRFSASAAGKLHCNRYKNLSEWGP